MKKMQVCILFVGLISTLPMSGMQRLRTYGMRAVKRPEPRPTQTFGQRVRAWFVGSSASAPVQTRGYGTTPVQQAQNPSLLSKIKSFFERKSPEERFVENLNGILRGSTVRKVQSVTDFRVFEDRIVFSDKDLERAKEFIDNNNELIKVYFKSPYYVGEGQTLPRGIRINKYNDPMFHESAFNIVMRYWFSYIKTEPLYYHRGYHNMYDSADLENIKNYLKLAQYIVSKGGAFGSLRTYEDIYSKILMPRYRQWNAGDLSQDRFYPIHHSEKTQIEAMKEIFQELDPLLMQCSKEDFKKYLLDAKEERKSIESDPNGYRKKMNDAEDIYNPKRKERREKVDKENYLKAKRERKRVLWYYANNVRFDEYVSERVQRYWDDVQFIEEEFQEWLKDPINFIDFDYGIGTSKKYSSKSQSEKNKSNYKEKFNQQGGFGYQEKSIQSLLGLSDTASTAEIKAKFYAFMKQYHPDQWPKNITKEEREVIEKKVKEVTAAWNEYKKELKQQ